MADETRKTDSEGLEPAGGGRGVKDESARASARDPARSAWWRAVGLVAVSICGSVQADSLAPRTQDAKIGLSPAVVSKLQSALDDWAGSTDHLGVSAAVILADGEEWIGTAGTTAAKQPLEPEHLIGIASITKTMTGAVVLGLAESDALNLDDPVSRWLPPIDNVDPQITVRQLLNHTNGLANYTRHPAFNAAVNADPSHRFTARELLAYVGPKSFDRGERTQYTNSSFVLLGMIAEAATERSITQLYRERLWGPLELKEIFLPGFGEPAGPIARAWAGSPTSPQALDPLENMALVTIGNSAFGLFSNARTVARWGRVVHRQALRRRDA